VALGSSSVYLLRTSEHLTLSLFRMTFLTFGCSRVSLWRLLVAPWFLFAESRSNAIVKFPDDFLVFLVAVVCLFGGSW